MTQNLPRLLLSSFYIFYLEAYLHLHRNLVFQPFQCHAFALLDCHFDSLLCIFKLRGAVPFRGAVVRIDRPPDNIRLQVVQPGDSFFIPEVARTTRQRPFCRESQTCEIRCPPGIPSPQTAPSSPEILCGINRVSGRFDRWSAGN